MTWVEHREVGYDAPIALHLAFTTLRWGIGLSLKQKRRPLRWSMRILLGKWHLCFTFG
jgi:hypothetical protein